MNEESRKKIRHPNVPITFLRRNHHDEDVIPSSEDGQCLRYHDTPRRLILVFFILMLVVSTSAALSSSNASRSRVAVVGSGAVGGYYGARLWEAGHTVKFHMRAGPHCVASTLDGLKVTSVHGDIFIPPDELLVYERTEDMGEVDWVIVSLKSSALDIVPSLIRPLLSKDTRVLCIMNGLIEDDLLDFMAQVDSPPDATVTSKDSSSAISRLSCCSALLGGMALICSNRIAPGKIDHSYAGLLSAGVAAVSDIGDSFEKHEQAFRELWKPTKVETAVEPSLLRGRWTKNVWNLPFNGISVAMGGITVDKIVQDPGLRELAYEVMDETIAIANADLEQQHERSSLSIPSLGEAEKKRMMELSDGMGPYKTSTMLDLTERRPMEVRYLFRKPLERARQLGVPAPHLETLVTQIEAYQRMYNLF